MTERYFATGLKGWVQIWRTKGGELKAHPSEVTKNVTFTQRGWWPENDRKVKKTVIIKTVHYTGGKVIETLTASAFRRATCIGVGLGGMLELRRDHLVALKLEESE